ncbi:MAG: peptidase M75 [Bacteroidales bacterium]|nr:peptidase M75 [Bacteroidales bacterium]
MKKLFRNAMFALASVMMLSLTACGDKDNDNDKTTSADEPAAYQTIADQFVNGTVIPTYTKLAANTEQLVEDLQTLQNDKTQANLDKATVTFLTARQWWERSEAFLFGPANDFGIDPHIDNWPLDEDGFNTMMANDAQMAQLAGEEGDSYAGEYLGRALLGFHGIEYILFTDGHAKNVADISDKELIYAIAVAGDLRNRCYQLEVSWAGDAAPAAHVEKVEDLELNCTVGGGSLSYGESMLRAGKAGSIYVNYTAVMQEICGGGSTIADEVGASKIGKAYHGEDITYIESPYSQKSITDFHDNIISIQNAYMGGLEGETRDEAKSLHNYVKSVNADLDTKVIDAINNALAKIDAMPAPFVKNYSKKANEAAIDACAALDEVLQELSSYLAK